MKMRLITGIFILLVSGVFYKGYGQREQMTIKISDPALRGYLNIINPKGSITITGYDGDVILITAFSRYDTDYKTGSNSGNKLFSVRETNNRVTIYRTESNKTIDFNLKIPKKFSIKASSMDNGIVEVFGVNGDIEAVNHSGDVTLESITGSAVVSTVNGKIVASFLKTDPDSPMMFTSLEGSIEIYLPEKTNANFRMRSHNGKIISDFKVKSLQQPKETNQEADYRLISDEGWTVGAINNGGPEYMINTYNGNIYLKKGRKVL